MLQIEKILTYGERLKNFLESENYHNQNISTFYAIIKRDSMVTLFLSKLSNGDKIKVIYVTYFLFKGYDENTIIEIVNNLKYYEVTQYINPGYREELCEDCYGNGRIDCNNCDGDGDFVCDNCEGSGNVTCSECDGDGTMNWDESGDFEDCSSCDGEGVESCHECDGDGRITCNSCDGDGDYDCDTCDGTGQIESDDEFFDEETISIAYVNTDNSPNIEFGTLMDSTEYENFEEGKDYPLILNRVEFDRNTSRDDLERKYKTEMDEYIVIIENGVINEYPFKVM